MYDPELYAGANEFLVEDTIQCMNKVKDILPSQHGEVALDVGCGPGDVTALILPRYLHSDYKMIGCDISESMVSHAQANYGNDRISFKLLDIESRDIWADWKKESFDKIFSNYCLHWISDQRLAAENMYNLLKKDGYIVTTFLTKHPIIEFFDTIIKNPKWQPYVKRWPGWRAIFDSNANEDYTKILNEVGFEVMAANVSKRETFHKSKERFLAYLEAVNPFISNIPTEKKKEYISDCKDSLQQLGAILLNDEGHITYQYTLFTTVAKKKGNK